jgi:thymidylate synthase
MEIESIHARDLWKKVLKYIQDTGDSFTDHDKRTCIECLNITLSLTQVSDIHSPLEIISQSKKWVYPKAKEIENFVLDGHLSPSFAYSYGERLFLHSGPSSINQIDSYIIPLLKKNPYSRRAVAVIWNPSKDADFKAHVPGLLYVDFKLRHNMLHASCSIRSCDALIGLPANMYELYVLASYVAKKNWCSLLLARFCRET